MKRVLSSISSIFLWLFFFAFVLSAPAVASPVGTPLNQQINDYFVQLKDTFDKIADNSAVKTTSLSRTDRYFVNTLRKQQVLYSLIRTNSKGMVTNEIIRGQAPERNYRSIAHQRWFKQVQQTGREYFGFLKENTGRYYLFWSKPVFKTRRSGSQTFVGSIAVKVDIWDAIHDFTQNSSTPFLVTLNSMSLYSHKWNEPEQFEKKSLTIPGVENVSVSYAYEKQAEPVASSESSPAENSDQISAGQDSDSAKQNQKDPSIASSSKGMFTALGIILVLLVILIAVGIKVFTGLRHRALMKKIDRDNSLF